MFSKYIHKFTFKVANQVYTATVEHDMTPEEWKATLNRCKDKLFTPVGLTIISSETKKREENDSDLNKNGYITDGTSIIHGERVGNYERCTSTK